MPSLINDNEGIDNKLKTCLICDAQVIHLTKHMKVHNKDYSEQCYICDKKFSLKKYLQVHMKTHDPKKINDGLNFLLEDKANNVSKNIDKLHPCFDCGKTFSTKFNLNKHMKQKHHDEAKKSKSETNINSDNTNKVLINCEHCPKKFVSFETLMEHLENTKKNDTVLKCDICDKVFSKSYNLKVHMDSVHKDRSFPCDKCEKTYTRKIKLTEHVNRSHTKVQCSICKITFNNSKEMKKQRKEILQFI